MFPVCLPFFIARLHASAEVTGTGVKEKATGNLPVPRDPSPAVQR
jgi:hypothetical protein